MKHTLSITLVILGMFLAAQFIGIGILYKYKDSTKSLETGNFETQKTPGLDSPNLEDLGLDETKPIDQIKGIIPIVIAILIGTGLLFVLIKYRLAFVWKFWFLIAVTVALYKAFWAFVPLRIFDVPIAFGIALLLAIWKIFRPNVYIHNITELFIYGGLAAIFFNLFHVWSIIILMIFIALYDAYAVWKSKHMVTLAKSQAEAKVFAGLLIPYQLKKVQMTRKEKVPSKKMKVRTAILGGGDIGFPLMFAGVVMKEFGLWQSLVIPFFALLGLGILLFIAKEEKFYPAMPFISGGCLLGLGAIWLIGLI